MPEFKLGQGQTIYTDGVWYRLKTAADAALECLVWSEQPDDEDWSKAPIHREVAFSIMADVADFCSIPEVQEVCERNMMDYSFIGHNLYLSANGHGTGFRDRTLPKGGVEVLQLHTEGFERHLYLAGDGFIRSE